MYARYLLTALVTLSTALAAPRDESEKVKRDYLPISITSPIPSFVGAGETIALSWTGGGGVYDLKFDSSAPGDRYAVCLSTSSFWGACLYDKPQDLMLSTTETTFEYTVTDGQRM
jgi:hypothetical protein